MSHRNRAIAILVLLACGFTVISFNLIQIQLVDHDMYWRLAVENHLHPETIPARRGAIFDSEGNVLAQTEIKTDLYVDGKLMSDPAQQLSAIAQVLQVPDTQLMTVFDPHNRHALLVKNIDDSAVTQLLAMKLNSLIFEPHDVRVYPNNGMAAHVLGFTGQDGHGTTGMEKEMDDVLSGVPGERWVERDGKKKEIAGYQTRERSAVDGDNVTLTVNMAIQHVVEEQLDQIVQTYQPDGAYIIVMDPHTGEILAMGSRPTFDPNDGTTRTPERIQNRCITDMVEPGSIFKIITLAGALNEHGMDLDTPIFCENGHFAYGGKILHDDEEKGFGSLSAMEVLAQSSNIGFAKIALDYLGAQKLYNYATEFGMGQRTNLFGGQGESGGLLRPVRQWSAISITRIPMGQEVCATPLQMVTAMSVIANGGRLVQPRLARDVKDTEGRVVKIYPPRIIRQVISPDVAAEVARALHQVTIDGTAKNVRITDASGAGYSYAGKTGTAQKVVNGQYSHTQHVASFIGFMPAEDPAFVALVMVDSPHTAKNKDYGAEVSAPVFATIAGQVAQILNLPPDIPAPTAPVLSSNTPAPL